MSGKGLPLTDFVVLWGLSNELLRSLIIMKTAFPSVPAVLFPVVLVEPHSGLQFLEPKLSI